MSGLIYIAIWTYDSYLQWVIWLQWLVAWFVALRERCLIFSPLCLKSAFCMMVLFQLKSSTRGFHSTDISISKNYNSISEFFCSKDSYDNMTILTIYSFGLEYTKAFGALFKGYLVRPV